MGETRGPTAGRSRWAAIGAAVAVVLGSGGLMTASATIDAGSKPVFVPIPPCRVMDTRPAPDTVGPRASAIGARETHSIQVRGDNGNCTGIPADAVALTMNIAAIAPDASSFLTVFPADVPRPLATTLNYVGGQAPLSNATTVRIAPDGRISFFNLNGTVHVAADILGYYVDHTHDDRYYTKSQIDARLAGGVFRASVGDTGVLLTGGASPGVTSTRTGTGVYTVDFGRNMINCSWTVSITGYLIGPIPPIQGGPGLIDAAGIPTPTFSSLRVRTWNATGTTPTNMPFTVIAVC